MEEGQDASDGPEQPLALSYNTLALGHWWYWRQNVSIPAARVE